MVRWPLLVVLVLTACAGKQGWESITREVYVHTLPQGATVAVDGKEMGRSPVSASVPSGQPVAGGGEAPATVTALLPGFREGHANLDRRDLPPEIVLVLEPDIAGEEPHPPPAWTDAAGLQATGARLAAAGRCPDALAFFDRALELEPRIPVALREGGRCQAKLGNRAPASQMLGRYLMNHPDAPDADQVRSQLDALDSGRTIDLKGIP